MTMRKTNRLTCSAALVLAALALAGCAHTQPPATETEDAPPAIAVQKPETIPLKKALNAAPEEPAEEEAAPEGAGQPEWDEAPPTEDEPEQTAASTAPAEQTPIQNPDPAPESDSAPAPTPEPEPQPTPEPASAPEPTPEPEPERASEPAPPPAYGAVPFHLAAGTGKWWSIDSSDSAYWAMQEQINAGRAAGGLPALTMDGNLSTIASSRCESFVAGGPFDHSGMVTVSEICAAGPLGSASAACAAWIASDVHYANIMRTDITSMGVGCWFCDVDGNQYTYWTVTFG